MQIKVEKKFGNQPCSSIKVEKQRVLCKEKEKGVMNKKGIAKEPFRKAKRRQESRREKRFSGSLFLLGEV